MPFVFIGGDKSVKAGEVRVETKRFNVLKFNDAGLSGGLLRGAALYSEGSNSRKVSFIFVLFYFLKDLRTRYIK